MSRADDLIERLQAEIVKRDARIAELAALKAQQPSAGVAADRSVIEEVIKHMDHVWSGEADEDVTGELIRRLREYGRLNPCRAQAVPLPYWEPCNPGCDPEFNGQRSKDCAQLCHQARAALNAGRAVAVPDGYAMVPAEPTPQMQVAAASAIRIDTTAVNKLFTGNAVYRAAIAAAPSAQQKESGDE